MTTDSPGPLDRRAIKATLATSGRADPQVATDTTARSALKAMRGRKERKATLGRQERPALLAQPDHRAPLDLRDRQERIVRFPGPRVRRDRRAK